MPELKIWHEPDEMMLTVWLQVVVLLQQSIACQVRV
jgi:hypothetical protein